MTNQAKRWYLIGEFLILFVALPVVLFLFRKAIAHKVAVIILLTAGPCTLYLLMGKRFPRQAFLRTDQWRQHLIWIAITFIPPALAMTACTAYLIADKFFIFPKESLAFWGLLLVFYPILGAYPQEIIFRGFFFRRYRTLFPKRLTMVLVSSLCFGWAHLMYANWVAPVLSGVGGVLFAYRYLRSNSLLMVGIEHGLWGNFLFTVGIGWYFYSGAIL